MSKVLEPEAEDNTGTTEETVPPTLDEIAREGARRMLVAALEEEVSRYVEVHADARRERPAAGRAQRPCAVPHGDLRRGDDAGRGAAGERPSG